MDLYIFPECASHHNGYGICVDYGYKKLLPKKEDIVIWYTKEKNIPYFKENDIIIDRNISTFKRISNVIQGKPSTELSFSDLSFLKNYKFENIHCDEILFFKALRKLFPNQHINVRLHNCFSRILERKRLLNIPVDPKFHLILHLCRNAEKYIFSDTNCTKIFITKEDQEYYTSMYGITSDSELWNFSPHKQTIVQWEHFNPKLVWFGGVDAHKKSSINWFISNVFLPLKNKHQELTFHLYGRETNFFNNPQNGIYGHGFYKGKDLIPEKNVLYVNPDIIGGGIKLKLISLIENGIPFITSPFGFEGYSKSLIDNKQCFVVEEKNWIKKIENILYN